MRKEYEFYHHFPECLAGYVSVSNRVVMMKIKAPPVNLNVIQVYAPKSTHSNEEGEEFYGMIEQAKSHCKNHEITVSMGDMNAKVGGGRQGSVGSFWVKRAE